MSDVSRTLTVVSTSRWKSRSLLNHGVLWLFILIELFPLYMMFQVSVKDNGQFVKNPWLPTAPNAWQGSNWSDALALMLPYIANTIFVSALTTIGTVTFAVLAAYFFTRHRLPFARTIWAFFMALMLMPTVANIVPLFTLLNRLNLLNTLWALVAVGIAGSLVFTVFVLRNFMEDIPRDLFEAAEIDGAGHLQQLKVVVLPLSMPIIGTLAILAFLRSWNDFLLPLIVLRDQELFTLGVGLIYLDADSVKQWGRIMAAYSVASIPLILLFLFTMRFFVRGLSQGAVKG